ncbi:hypothetical protein Mal65_54470 [Crateriforma conspicua]|nr:hypothetical protein Mal65_54470 [Crateriforma conspicua]
MSPLSATGVLERKSNLRRSTRTTKPPTQDPTPAKPPLDLRIERNLQYEPMSIWVTASPTY